MEVAEQTKSREEMKSASKKKASQRKRAKTRVKEHVYTGEVGELEMDSKTLALGDGAVAGVSGRREAKSSTNEIDDIFGQKKKRSQFAVDDNATGNTSGGSERPLQSKKKGKKTTGLARNGLGTGDGDDGALVSPAERRVKTSTSRRKTADGLAIYAEDELKWNSKDAGGTPLCPFDCECCF